jgi:predicted regulator of Ras-like GTPase activity (Roadblock/LC7/MglB family)
MLSIPYASIIRLIPNELWGKLAPAGVAGFNFTISRAAAQNQLSNGAVKVKFGDVRKGAPAGVFINTPAEDNRLVELPLSEILSQLHPDAYARRPDQHCVEVQPDVPDVFGATGGTAPIRVMQKQEISGTTILARQKTPDPAQAPAPAPAPVAPPPPPPIAQPSLANVTPFPSANVAPAAPIPRPAPAAAPVPAQSPIRMPATQPPAAARPASPAPQVPTIPRPVAAPPVRPLPRPATAAAPIAGGFAPATPFVPLAGPLAQGSFTMSLNVLAENWPDAVRQELAQLKIPDGKVAIPPVDVCEGLKRGRIQYPWRTLRSWIQPTPLYTAPSPNDDVVLELPLRTLTPAFLEFIRANPVNRQTAAAENITEFFRKAEQTAVGPEVLQTLMQPEPAVDDAPVFEVPEQLFSPAPPAPPPAPVHAPVHAPAPAPAPVVAAPAPGSGDAVVENGRFCIPVVTVAGTWGEALQQDIAQFNLSTSWVEIPIEALDTGLKTGRLEFSWAELCAWLNPPSKAAQVSINGDQRVALPVSIIAPLFLKLRPSAGRKKTSVMSDIPDLFNAAARPPTPPAAREPAPAPAAAPVAAPAAAPVAAPAAPAARPQATNISELFGEPSKKSWTPNEIVQRSMHLPGVAGALIALQDGLLVASSLPADMKTEMIAAFVPQIFGRLNQYSKELHLGDATSTGFTIEAGTLQIYNAGIIYFAALSRKGESLPVRDLQLIAAELSRHTK